MKEDLGHQMHIYTTHVRIDYEIVKIMCLIGRSEKGGRPDFTVGGQSLWLVISLRTKYVYGDLGKVTISCRMHPVTLKSSLNASNDPWKVKTITECINQSMKNSSSWRLYTGSLLNFGKILFTESKREKGGGEPR